MKTKNTMSYYKWEFLKELKQLCVKCTELKPSTAKKYAKDLFDKYSTEDGCINSYSDRDRQQKIELKNNLTKALNTVK